VGDEPLIILITQRDLAALGRQPKPNAECSESKTETRGGERKKKGIVHSGKLMACSRKPSFTEGEQCRARVYTPIRQQRHRGASWF
jgi:hypothetical protein